MTKPTLLELLEEAADEVWPGPVFNDHETPRHKLARALREARERLREEMEFQEREAPTNIYSEATACVLARINGDSDAAPRGPQPESPPDPVEAVRGVQCPVHGWAVGDIDCGRLGTGVKLHCEDRIRAASRRDTP